MKSKILLFIIACIPTIYFLTQYSMLADVVPIHANAQFEIDGYASKNWYFLICLLPFLIYTILVIVKKKIGDVNKKYLDKTTILLVIFMDVIAIVIMYGMFNEKTNIYSVIDILIGVLFIILGNMLGKLKQNRYFGIRIKYTLNSEYVWNRTHRVGGYLFVIAGIITVVVGLINYIAGFAVLIISLIAILIYITLFSRKLYLEEQKNAARSK